MVTHGYRNPRRPLLKIQVGNGFADWLGKNNHAFLCDYYNLDWLGKIKRPRIFAL